MNSICEFLAYPNMYIHVCVDIHIHIYVCSITRKAFISMSAVIIANFLSFESFSASKCDLPHSIWVWHLLNNSKFSYFYCKYECNNKTRRCTYVSMAYYIHTYIHTYMHMSNNILTTNSNQRQASFHQRATFNQNTHTHTYGTYTSTKHMPIKCVLTTATTTK